MGYSFEVFILGMSAINIIMLVINSFKDYKKNKELKKRQTAFREELKKEEEAKAKIARKLAYKLKKK